MKRSDASMEADSSKKSKAKLIDDEHVLELHLRKLRIHLLPQMTFFPGHSKTPFTVYVSRAATIGELHMKIVQALITRNNSGHAIL